MPNVIFSFTLTHTSGFAKPSVMDSIIFAFAPVPVVMMSAVYHRQHFPCILPHSSNHLYRRRRGVLFSDPVPVSRRWAALPSAPAGLTNSMPPRDVIYTVGDFMTKKEDLHVVKTMTTVEEALEALVEKRITGFPVIDDDWKLVGVVSDYDLLALDSISGAGQADTNLFPDVDSSWKSFNEIQRLLAKTNGKVVGDLMTPVPLTVCEATNLEDAVRLLLETKYRRLPVVDGDGKLVGIITRGNIVRAALQIKLGSERMSRDQT